MIDMIVMQLSKKGGVFVFCYLLLLLSKWHSQNCSSSWKEIIRALHLIRFVKLDSRLE